MLGPSSHLTFSASRPLIAAQVLSAITATPPSGANLAGIGVGSILTTFTTPGTFIAAASSYDTALPSTTGGRSITANSIPGTWMSCAYLALPVVMSNRSVIWTSPLPM